MNRSALPIVVIAGRPNVGKSTLFNALTRTRDALVADQPGVTRDRIYGRAVIDGTEVVLVDTGGLDPDPDSLVRGVGRQTQFALEEADVIAFVVDGRGAVTSEDFEIAARLRQLGKSVVLVVNKTDGIDVDTATSEFAVLGLSEPVPIAAAHRRGLDHLGAVIAAELPGQADDVETRDTQDTIRLALIGRPNVGKSRNYYKNYWPWSCY